MNVHIIQDPTNGEILAVFGSRSKSPASLERAVNHAIEYARDMGVEEDCVIDHAEWTLEQDSEVIRLFSGNTQTWEYTTSKL